MFHLNEEDDFWKSQERWNIMSWKLHKSSGVHTLKTDTEMVIHMLVEKKYHLMKKVMLQMLELKLESEDDKNTKTAQAQEITSLKKIVKKLETKGGSRTYKLRRLYKVGRSVRVVSFNEASLGDQEDASKQGRKIDDIDADEDITLENVHDAKMFDVNDLHGDKVFVEKEVPVEEVVSVAEEIVNAATIIEDEITLAQALAELKSVKPKVTTTTTATTLGILLQEPSESIPTTTTTIPSKDRGKAKFVEEVRLPREKDEANVALIEEWNDIQAKIETGYELAQRLQAEEQEELTVDEKATLFQQGRIVGIKRLLDDLRVTLAKLMLLVYKLLLLVFRVNAAGTKLQLLKDYNCRKDKDCSEKIKIASRSRLLS
ncbi:hypothetical protein Tco_0680764 [Tanacetum coccineum]|uniref:Uncharacterized protein n=1 Tax=Tanacetum coccineum TaxID=301880 RepID=A0ABQ4XMK8_9ASTR